MRSRGLLRSLVLFCASLSFGHAIAEPVVYSFSGYFTGRETNPQVGQLLPAFAVGSEGFTGTMTFDSEREGFDPEWAEPAIFPVLDLRIVAASGHVLAGRNPDTLRSSRILTVAREEGSETLSFRALGSIGSGTARHVLEVQFLWGAPDQGQLPPGQPGQGQSPDDLRTLDLEALDPSGWLLHISAYPASCYPECTSSDRLVAQIGPFERLPSWDGSLTDFTNGAPGWVPQTGSWVADNGQYRNTSNLQASVSVLGTAAALDYRIDARMNLQWSASGNRGGLVYDYVNASNYRAVLIAAQNSTNTSWLEAIEVVGGVRRVVARLPQPGSWRSGVWGNVSVSRIDGVTTLVASGMSAPIWITQPEVAQGSVGVIASWNLVRFDDFVLGERRSPGE